MQNAGSGGPWSKYDVYLGNFGSASNSATGTVCCLATTAGHSEASVVGSTMSTCATLSERKRHQHDERAQPSTGSRARFVVESSAMERGDVHINNTTNMMRCHRN